MFDDDLKRYKEWVFSDKFITSFDLWLMMIGNEVYYEDKLKEYILRYIKKLGLGKDYLKLVMFSDRIDKLMKYIKEKNIPLNLAKTIIDNHLNILDYMLAYSASEVEMIDRIIGIFYLNVKNEIDNYLVGKVNIE